MFEKHLVLVHKKNFFTVKELKEYSKKNIHPKYNNKDKNLVIKFKINQEKENVKK